jgi:NAD(P)H-dependent FMN reductase
MKLTIISGSHRPNGESGRIARYIEKETKAAGHDVALIDLATTELPFWDEGLWGVDGLKDKWGKVWASLDKRLAESDAFVVVSPEYHGMVPAKLKNFLLLTGNAATSNVAHKPGMIVSVSAGINGGYPVAELRSHGVKNNRMVWTPEHIIVRNAASMLQDKPVAEQDKHDVELRERMTYALGVLEEYAVALAAARATGKLTDKRYANGM